MKKTVATIISLVILIIALFGVGFVTGRNVGKQDAINHYYPLCGVVTELDREQDVVTITDCAGLMWQFTECDDWQEGDIACCVMHDQGTPDSVLDDVIVSVRYGGWMGEGVSEG